MTRMTTRTLQQTAVTIAAGSMVFTLSVWVWMLTRPPGTFHDQGGLAITLFYFPATFVVWLVCGLASVAFRRRRTEGESEADVARSSKLRRVVCGLIALGLLMSIGTLFVA
jgi:hypothetical protein